MGKFVLFREFQQANIVKNTKELEGKTAAEILKMFQHEDLILFIKTPFFSEPIDKFSEPLKLYPEVILTTKPQEKEELQLEDDLPNCYFFFKDLTFPHQISLYICTNIIDADVPPFEVIVDLDSVYNGNDLFKLIDHSFTMDHSEPSTESFELNESADTIIKRARSKHILFNFKLSESSYKLIKKRNNVLQEIQETENNYLNDIQVLLDYWEPNIRQNRILSESEITRIFKEFPTILECHKLFLQSLRSRGCNFSAMVGDLFLEFADYFKLSLPYISSYHTIISILNSKPRVLTINNPENGKDLTSYLITPVQRIPRYILFLGELLKKTPTCHPDYEELELASSRIQNITIEMDISTKRAQQMNEIWMIQKSLTKPLTLISPNRCLKYTLNITFKSEPCHLYLFNDFILIASYDKRSQTVLLSSPLLNFHYFPCFSQIGFQVKKKIYYAQFQSEETRLQFVENLEDLRLSQDKRSSADLSMFLWSNPFVPKYLPKLSFIDGVQVNDSYVFFGDGTLVTVNMKIGAISSSQSPFGSRTGFAMAGNGTDRIFIVGGYVRQTDEYYNDIWQYEVFLNKWTNLTRGSSTREFQPRCEHVVLYDDNKLYIFGGRLRKNFLNDVSIYYLTTNKWNVLKLDFSPSPRSLHSAVMIEKKIIVLGGHNQQTVFNDVNVFDTDTLKWNAVMVNCSIIPKRYGHRSIALQNMIVTIGGTADGETVPKPSVIDANDNFSCKVYKCAGNYPFNEQIEGGFAVCFDEERLNMYVYNHCSIFLVQLPQDIKQTYVCNSQNEIHGRIFHTTVSNSKRQSATIEEGDLFQSIQNRRRMQKFGTCYVPKAKNVSAFPRSRVRMHIDRKAMMLPENEFTGIMTKLPNTIQYSDLQRKPSPSHFSASGSDCPQEDDDNEKEKKLKKSNKAKKKAATSGSDCEANETSKSSKKNPIEMIKKVFKKKSTTSANSDTNGHATTTAAAAASNKQHEQKKNKATKGTSSDNDSDDKNPNKKSHSNRQESGKIKQSKSSVSDNECDHDKKKQQVRHSRSFSSDHENDDQNEHKKHHQNTQSILSTPAISESQMQHGSTLDSAPLKSEDSDE